MNFKSGFSRLSLALILTLSLGFAVFADTIRLRDGSIIKGKIIGFGGGKFTVLIADGARRREINFSVGEVESITFDAAASVNSSSGGSTLPTTAPPATAEAETPVVVAPVKVSAPVVAAPVKSPTSAPLKPITINASVAADDTSNGWTNSGFVVRRGQKIRIGAAGEISLGGGRSVAAGGDASLTDANKLLANEATGGLIAVIGDDNNEFIFIGAGREFVAERDGALFLGVNEGNLADNSGKFAVKIDIYPN